MDERNNTPNKKKPEPRKEPFQHPGFAGSNTILIIDIILVIIVLILIYIGFTGWKDLIKSLHKAKDDFEDGVNQL
jgi:hypothetical protein